MDDHMIDPEQAEKLEEPGRYRILSKEELLATIDRGDTVVDIGSGTGFFSDEMAAVAERVYAVDFQAEMHEYYQNKGVPENVELVHSRASTVDIDEADLVVSILSAHEIDLEAALATFEAILGGSGRLFIVDWSANAETDGPPPREKRYTAAETAEVVGRRFEVVEAEERYDTFRLVATE